MNQCAIKWRRRAEAKNGGWLGCAHKLLAESVPLEGPLRADARKNAH